MREALLRWFGHALKSVDPEELVFRNLAGKTGPVTVIALGKAAPAMCRGAARALGEVRGICVTHRLDRVPDGVELVIGDHPVPGERSLEAGRLVADLARQTAGECLVLVSGGGSALCESPTPGIDSDYLIEITRSMVASGAPIDELNLVRGHLSAIKGGGLGEIIPGGVSTLVLSDVTRDRPGMVASGPTIPMPSDPDGVVAIIRSHGLEVGTAVETALRTRVASDRVTPVSVIGDGRMAADGLRRAAEGDGVTSRVLPGWIDGPVVPNLDELFTSQGEELLISAGEPHVTPVGTGVGGRCTHTALLAATRIADTGNVFASLATDGCDGSSGGAGAIVDGATLERGGDPVQALAEFDSATYLRGTGDLVITGDTGTNVADLWALWRARPA